MTIDGQVCFYKWPFADAVESRGYISWPWGALIGLHGIPSCSWWQSCPPLWIVSVYVKYWGQSTALWVQMVALPCLRLTTHPPTPPPPPIDSIRDITGAEKTIWKTSSIQVASRISYERIYNYTIHTRYLAWLYCTTREVQCIKYFKLVFLEIQNVRRWSVFPKQVTYTTDQSNCYSFDSFYIFSKYQDCSQIQHFWTKSSNAHTMPEIEIKMGINLLSGRLASFALGITRFVLYVSYSIFRVKRCYCNNTFKPSMYLVSWYHFCAGLWCVRVRVCACVCMSILRLLIITYALWSLIM